MKDGPDHPVGKQKYVIVGAGAAGLSAAYTISKHSPNAEIHLVEANNRAGGHAWTIPVPGEEELVDIGFMVLNEATYPNLLRIFDELNVPLALSDMSLSIFKPGGISWSFQSSIQWMLRSALSPRFWRFFKAHGAFADKARTYLANPDLYEQVSVGQFCKGLDEDFSNNWLLPFVSAVWSVGHGESCDFHALPLLRFMDNHRFLTLNTVPWLTPENRSTSYVNAILSQCPTITLHLNTLAQSINSSEKLLILENGDSMAYDRLILACSGPRQVSLAPPEVQWLKKFKVSRSRVVAHTKPYGMPDNKNDWCSWNVKSGEIGTTRASVTYWLSLIQNLDSEERFVSINPDSEPEGIFFDTFMEHPIMDKEASQAQDKEYEHQGTQDIYHAGAWLRHGFHEDAFLTGILAARRAMGREDIPVEFPTGSLGTYAAQPVCGITNHIRHGKGIESPPRKFSYPMYLWRWDTRCPPHGFHREDFLGDPSVPLDTQIRKELSERVGIWPLGKIEAVANLRWAGLSFNPITPFFAMNEKGELVALLCQVHNTPWGERTLYAMKVNPEGELQPSIHTKDMHVSPFNPPPSKENPLWDYKFELRGKHYLSVEARKDNVPIITATWELKRGPSTTATESRKEVEISKEATGYHTDKSQVWNDKKHDVKSGSWRTMIQIYYQAILMLISGYSMHSYDTPHLNRSPGNPIVWSLLFIMFPLFSTLSKGYWITSLALGITASSTMLWRLSGDVNLIALVVGVLCLPVIIGSLVLHLTMWASFFSLIGAIACIGVWILSPEGNLPKENRMNVGQGYLQLCVVAVIWSAFSSIGWWYWMLIIMWWSYLTFQFVRSFLDTLLGGFGKHSHPLRETIALEVSKRAIEAITCGDVLVRDGRVEKKEDGDPAGADSSEASILLVYRPIPFFWGLAAGDLGVGESYMRGDWSEFSPSDKKDEKLFSLLHNLAKHHNSPWIQRLDWLQLALPSYYIKRFTFLQQFGSLDRKSSAASIASHYDDGNKLFRSFLGEDMVYTSALFDDLGDSDGEENEKTMQDVLDGAQRRKMDRILELAKVPTGGKVVDIGSGWGALVNRAVQLGYDATGLCNCSSMVSLAQEKYGNDWFEKKDYRDIESTHDHDAVTCVEMIEAVPARHYGDFVASCDRALKPGGRVVMQVINALAFNNPVASRRDPLPLGTFVTTHIFPGQQVPNMEFLHEAFLETGSFKRVFSETTGHHYARTLAIWARNLETHPPSDLPIQVLRKYRYYLCWCRAAFHSELLQLSRVVFEKLPVQAKRE